MSNNISYQKQAIRQQFLLKRKKLTRSKVAFLSTKISKKFLTSKKILCFKKYLIYLPINNEVDTKYLIRFLKSSNKKLYVPAFYHDKWIISEIKNFDDLSKNKYGSLQPKNVLMVNIDQIDVAIVPGIVIDRTGTRIGFGKGVYDKLLKNFKGYKIGFGYGFQLINKLPRKNYDVKVDMFISEMGFEEFRTL